MFGNEGSRDRSMRSPKNLSRNREWDWDVLKTKNWAWREWYVGRILLRNVPSRESKRCSDSRDGYAFVGNRGSR